MSLEVLNAESTPLGVVPSRAKVLIVDDDDRNLLALAEVLGDIADIVQASSGEEALRWLLREQFAVIVLDVLMPGIDGYETAALIRARDQSKNTPIIFLTAINKEDGHLLRGYDSGAVDFVFKPFDPTVVRSKVAVFVSLHEKTLEIERTSVVQQRLLREKLDAQAESLAALSALRQAEERQDLILASLPMAVYVEDIMDGARRYVAGNLKQITGFDASDFLNDPSLWPSRIQRDLESDPGPGTPTAQTREYRWRHADGSHRVFLDQSVPLDAEGDAIAGTIRDVTEQRLMQDQLLQAQKMDAIGKLTGGVAHDFNNLLASVLSGLSLIEKRAQLEGKSLEVLRMTRHAAEQGKHLVSRLLSFSRRQNLSPQVVALGPICESLNSMLTPTLGGLITLEWEVQDDLWRTFADASQLELALMNLIINSRDAQPDGGKIVVRLVNRKHAGSKELPPGDFVVLTVADTGVGIPADVLPFVLEPFFTTKEVGRGTGLGLSMAYGFAKQSAGSLQIRSTTGSGTEVDLWLPRAQEDARVQAHANVDGGLSRAVESGGARVLLVDDSDTLRRLTAMQLTDAGFVVKTAPSGADAIALIRQDPNGVDVLLTDYAMPMMTGVELISAARQYRSNLPAVIITGYAELDAIKSRPQDVAVLAKPFTIDGLLDALGTSLGRSEQPVQLARQPSI
jgi:signal transduction histidine kinase